jgi:hypothetical protein
LVSIPEYAFVASERARGRARRAVAALNALGYDARHYGAESEETRRAKATVFCDLRAERPAIYDVHELPADCGAAQVLTAASAELAQRAAAALGHLVEIVPEPLEGVRLEPRAARARPRSRPLEWLARRAGLATDAWRTRLLWTGENTDVEAIVGAYPKLEALGREIALELHCVAAPEVLEALHIRGDAVKVSFEEETKEGFARALEACDFGLVPPDPRRERMVLNAGRLAIPVADPCDAIRRALADPQEVLEGVRAAQERLDAVHAPQVVARAWVRIFTRLG